MGIFMSRATIFCYIADGVLGYEGDYEAPPRIMKDGFVSLGSSFVDFYYYQV